MTLLASMVACSLVDFVSYTLYSAADASESAMASPLALAEVDRLRSVCAEASRTRTRLTSAVTAAHGATSFSPRPPRKDDLLDFMGCNLTEGTGQHAKPLFAADVGRAEGPVRAGVAKGPCHPLPRPCGRGGPRTR